MIDVAPLNIEPNIASPDEFYAALLDAHRELTTAQSERLNARLVLLLANHVGDLDVIRDALRRARLDVDDPADSAAGARPPFPLDGEGDS